MLDRLAGTTLAVVIVNWNRKTDLLRCLGSLEQAITTTSHTMATIVVDNGSTDGSVAAIRSTFPDVVLIESDRNLGFAEGNNIALRFVLESGCPYALLLNNDTVVAPDALTQLLDPMLADPSIAVSGPAICYLSSPQQVWSAGGTIDWRSGVVANAFTDSGLADLPREIYPVEHLSGCCMLVRTSAIADAGLLDARFYMYYEETEWCVRIARRGGRLVINPKSRIWHDISPLAQSGSPAIAYYMTRNHLLFLRAAHARPSAWIRTLYRQFRTVASLFLTHHSPERVRGRVPMLLAFRDFALGRFGPTTLPRMLR